MRKIAGYLTKNRSEKDQKIAQSTHESEYIKSRKTFWRNSKQLLRFPFNAPDECCMAVELEPDGLKEIHGWVRYPNAFFE
ncbi:hypothetical protein [Phocaeicola salanitronis]|uniref:hypothetical protein n=1 Tax=Phocaeicola salanitronis TaxID=376805 RepID=UPI0002FC2EAC|nr:hypothetical protein [Phocaeicola salanitronis]